MEGFYPYSTFTQNTDNTETLLDSVPIIDQQTEVVGHKVDTDTTGHVATPLVPTNVPAVGPSDANVIDKPEKTKEKSAKCTPSKPLKSKKGSDQESVLSTPAKKPRKTLGEGTNVKGVQTR